jgi:hypothetical protein
MKKRIRIYYLFTVLVLLALLWSCTQNVDGNNAVSGVGNTNCGKSIHQLESLGFQPVYGADAKLYSKSYGDTVLVISYQSEDDVMWDKKWYIAFGKAEQNLSSKLTDLEFTTVAKQTKEYPDDMEKHIIKKINTPVLYTALHQLGNKEFIVSYGCPR